MLKTYHMKNPNTQDSYATCEGNDKQLAKTDTWYLKRVSYYLVQEKGTRTYKNPF